MQEATVNIIDAIKYLTPEIIIAIGLVAIVVTDLIFSQKKIIHILSVAIIFVAGYFVLNQLSVNSSTLSFATQSNKNFGMFTLDPFASFFKLFVLVATLGLIAFSYSSEEIKKVNMRLGEYYALAFGMLLGMTVLVSATDLVLIYLSLEMISLSSYVLAGFTKLRTRSSEASIKYLLYGSASSAVMLFGISLIYGITGNTNLFEIQNYLLNSNINTMALSVSLIMIFVGIAYKIAAAPFHFWAPDVYEGAPISITAYLSVASKAAGFALLIRFLSATFRLSAETDGSWQLLGLFNWKELIIIISILTMVWGNFSALWQTNLKRLLAYSSVAHAGYMLLGVAVLSDKGLSAVLIYLIFYLFMNLGAFYIVMLIANRTNTEDLEKLKGFGFVSPLLGVSLIIFLVSLTGLPPTSGFIGKLYIFIALVDAKMFTVAVIALLNTVVSLYYYAKVFKYFYLSKEKHEKVAQVSKFDATIIIVFLIPTLLFGVYFTPIVNFVRSLMEIFTFN